MDRNREEQKRPPGSPLDPRWEKLVALLYGELPPEEEQSLRMEIESDAALRAEWEEISGARSLLQSWEVPETAKEPSFVFVTPEPARRRNGSARSAATGWRERLSRLLPSAPWAIAATATAVMLLAVSGARIDRYDGGFALRFGARPQAVPTMAESAQPSAGATPASMPFVLPASGTLGALGTNPVQTVRGDDSRYVTKEAFDSYSQGMTRTLVALLNEYTLQRDREMGQVLRVGFDGFSQKQSTDYEDLRQRLEDLRVAFAQQQLQTDTQLEYLMQHTEQEALQPEKGTPLEGSEGVGK